MVERVSIWSPHNKNNFNTINKMILESEILRQAINDCGSMVRKYQFEKDKKDICSFWWKQIIQLTKKRKKVLKEEHRQAKEIADYFE